MNAHLLACAAGRCAILAVVGHLMTSLAMAAPVQYTIDSTASSLTLSGSFQGAPISGQTSNGLIARFSGIISGDLVGGTLSFTGGSQVIGVANPDAAFFLPAGAGVTHYGWMIAAVPGQVGAHRDLQFDLASGTASHGVAGAYAMVIDAGHIDYAGPVTGAGSINLNGDPATNVSLLPVSISTVGMLETLQLPVQLTFDGDAGVIQTFQGTIVATRPVPEPSSLVLLAIGAAGVCLMRSFRRA